MCSCRTSNYSWSIPCQEIVQRACILLTFRDGNGRMCRLITSAVMLAIVPLCWPSCHFQMVLSVHRCRGKRQSYVDAVVERREQEYQQPIELATLIIKGVYYGSLIVKRLRDHLKLGEITCAAGDSGLKIEVQIVLCVKQLSFSVYHALACCVKCIKFSTVKL